MEHNAYVACEEKKWKDKSVFALTERELTITMIDLLKTLPRKGRGNMLLYINNFSRERESIGKNQMETLQIIKKKTIRNIKRKGCLLVDRRWPRRK